ncbi:pyruvate, phosphate dikinase [Alphaproteobacteria bacterium]|nr:pyruvate, phosphate dikinase [Alphaproteobacteria bacterium]
MTGFGTKAETLLRLADANFPVPMVFYFTVADYRMVGQKILHEVQALFSPISAELAVRSSASSEDRPDASMAGAFTSVLSVPVNDIGALKKAVQSVVAKLSSDDDQILVQPMVKNVVMSGVVMTRALDDGSPYYVVSYDDVSGQTDSITSGRGAHKTVYVYRGVKEDDFDSTRLRLTIKQVRSLERYFSQAPLDIEFAMDSDEVVYILQVRPIAAAGKWSPSTVHEVNARIVHVEQFIKRSMNPHHGLFGHKTIFGVMPDWNPAEMIGISPRPLAYSLYRRLITHRVWSLAREEMGYRPMPPVDLMVSIGGKPYIDVRASFNSFLPQGLPTKICARLVDAWLERLDKNPQFHDKIEFEIVPTVTDLNSGEKFNIRYPDLLSQTELTEYHVLLRQLSNEAIRPEGSLNTAMSRIALLRDRQESDDWQDEKVDVFDCGLRLGQLLEECTHLGTVPFSVVARHGFIAEALLRSAVETGVFSSERVADFKRSIKTVSGELTQAFALVLQGKMDEKDFLLVYGHLRPGTYDILSPAYVHRKDLFGAGNVPERSEADGPFYLTQQEKTLLSGGLVNVGLNFSPERFFEYARQAIAAREYAKFVFTRHIHRILETLTLWGDKMGLDKDDISMLPIEEITGTLTSPLPSEGQSYFRERVVAHREQYAIDRSFKLAYLIRSPRDVYIAPQHRSEPNFITSKRVEAPMALLDARSESASDLRGKIACIESADPGYDWIFTQGISGLVTRYGGSNSHMAIRCAEYGLPAAIGCGDLIFEQVWSGQLCILDCASRTVTPLRKGTDRCLL